MDAKRIGELGKAVADRPSGNVTLLVKELCELVQSSGTENPGLCKAAKALEGEETAQAVTVQASDLRELLEAVSRKPHRGSSGGSSPANPPDGPPKQ